MTTSPLKKIIVIYNVSEFVELDFFFKKEFGDLVSYLTKMDFELEKSIFKPDIQIYKGKTKSNYSFIIHIDNEDYVSYINRFSSYEK